MDNAVGVIANTITTDALWGCVSSVMPIVLTVTLFALGFYLVRRATKKVSRGKGGA